MKELKVSNLYLSYNFGALALQNINFEVAKGSILTIFAPSEGGKTSLIKAIAGLYPVQRGEIFLNGKNITNAPVKDRNVAVMYQDNSFFKYKSVFNNLLYPLKIRKMPLTDAINKVNAVIDEFELTQYKNTKIRKLDKETKFKVALARLFVREADLYLIDDPLNVFKGDERIRMFEYFLRYLKTLINSAPVVYATSSVEEIKVLSDSVIIMNYGVQLQAGCLGSIVARPNNLLSYKLFNKNAIIEELTLFGNNDKAYLKIGEEIIYIDIDKLINPIYIGSEILACYLYSENKIDKSSLLLFDKNSEKLIYFD